MRETPTRSWRGVSAEERLAQRRILLVEAGVEVIGTRGWADTKVKDVVRAAGLTERSFYQVFADRDALLVAVFEQIHDETLAAILAAVDASADADVRVMARAAIAAGLAVLTDDPRKGRIVMIESVKNEALHEFRQEKFNAVVVMLSLLGQQHFTEVDPVDAELSAHMVVGAETELVTAYLAGRLQVSRDRLIDHLTELHLAAVSISSVPDRGAATGAGASN